MIGVSIVVLVPEWRCTHTAFFFVVTLEHGIFQPWWENTPRKIDFLFLLGGEIIFSQPLNTATTPQPRETPYLFIIALLPIHVTHTTKKTTRTENIHEVGYYWDKERELLFFWNQGQIIFRKMIWYSPDFVFICEISERQKPDFNSRYCSSIETSVVGWHD